MRTALVAWVLAGAGPTFAQLGKPCDSNADCRSGTLCALTVCLPIFAPFEGELEIFGRSSCAALYSDDIHDSIQQTGYTCPGCFQTGAVTFGGGFSTSAGAATTTEAGVAYGRRGQYGCYATGCSGWEFAVPSVSVYAAAVSYADFSRIAGSSTIVATNGSIGPVEVTTIQGTGSGISGASIGLSLSPLPIGAGTTFLSCSTTFEWMLDPCRPLVDAAWTGSAIGGTEAPLKSFAEAYGITRTACFRSPFDTGGPRRIDLRGGVYEVDPVGTVVRRNDPSRGEDLILRRVGGTGDAVIRAAPAPAP